MMGAASAAGVPLAKRLDEPQAGLASGAVPKSDLEALVDDHRKGAAQRRLESGGGAPDTMPEVTRELTMLRGALLGLEHAAGQLVAVVEPVLNAGPVSPTLEGADTLPVESELGRELHELLKRTSRLEHLLLTTAHRVAL